jgi:hypothetical protein
MTQLAQTLKHTIDEWSSQMMETNPMVRLTRSGRLPPRAFALYIETLRHVFEHSHKNLGHAAQRARSLSLPKLAEYLQRKADEEHGHDRWAMDDLKKLPAQTEIAPAQSLETFLRLQRDLIDQHPICFVAYALWAEYVTASVGDAWLQALASSGFQRDQVTAVGKHLDADREHAARAFDEIDELYTGEPGEAAVVGAVRAASQAFEAFCDEIHTVAVASA